MDERITLWRLGGTAPADVDAEGVFEAEIAGLFTLAGYGNRRYRASAPPPLSPLRVPMSQRLRWANAVIRSAIKLEPVKRFAA